MANIRVSNLTTTTTTPADDDYLVLDGATNGTRKILADKVTEPVEESVTALTTRVTTAEGNITDLTSDLSELRSDLTLNYDSDNKQIVITLPE